MIIETCDDLITKENNELKQEVERLMADLRWLKGKYTQEQVQPSQDNTSAGVKKLEKGETVTVLIVLTWFLHGLFNLRIL